MANHNQDHHDSDDRRLATTLIGGFLGAGKTTLLRHILEQKHHDDKKFQCAVIVNDMAELNIDQSFIESTGLIQSEEQMIAMENGCVCCTLQSDLVQQIRNLAKLNKFEYLIIEASGVSEPSEIAKLFAPCQDDHDHDESHGKDSKQTILFDMARLDTCVTVVDAAEFLPVLDESIEHELPQILMEQIEFASMILLNKTDLVTPEQLTKIQEQIKLINQDKAKGILTCRNSQVSLNHVIHTNSFQYQDFFSEKDLLDAFVLWDEQQQQNKNEKSCCTSSRARGESPCCRRARTIDSGKSQVLLPSKTVATSVGRSHQDITSFVYQARRPFHPERIQQDFLLKYWCGDVEEMKDVLIGEQEEEEVTKTTQDDNEEPKLKKPRLEATPQQKEQQQRHTNEKARIVCLLQEESKKRKALRVQEIGLVLRSKGCVWMANSHDVQGFLSQAGNVAAIDCLGVWNVLKAEAWDCGHNDDDNDDDSSSKKEKKARLRKKWESPFGDRRQELVFIGQGLKVHLIQACLDRALLTDEEFSMGVDGWKAMFGDAFLGGDGTDGEAQSEEETEEENPGATDNAS